ncbi:MAG: family 16 glycoside hydrolase [Chloroflexota bacterium]
MKSFRAGLAIMLLLSTAAFTHVFAADNSDPTDINKLLSDGNTEVTVDKLIKEVTFDDAEDWQTYNDTTSKASIKNGVYQMSVSDNSIIWGTSYDSQADTVIQVKTKQNSEDTNNAYGIMCRGDASNNGDGYYFQISGDGYYTISMMRGDTTTLVDWAESKAINPGKDENEITAVCAGDYLAMYVNDVLVAETNDKSFSEGYSGLSVASYGKEVNVEFDDVRIWSASVKGGATTTTTASTDTVSLPESLTSYDGKPKEAIAELEQLGVIPSGSSQIFNESHAYFAGQGNWFTPLASKSPHKNIVMGGELTFTVGSTTKFESCTFLSRINLNNQNVATTYIEVGIGNDSYPYIFDNYSEAQDGHIEVGTTKLDLKQPHHVLFTTIDDLANVYVDGNLEISNFKIAERAGTYGISLSGRGPKARCDGKNLWAFSVPSVKPGQCAVSSAKVANKRSGPGTKFEAAGQLAAGDETVVIGQAKAADGKSWWELEDETWVREDLVTAVGDCANVPITKPS